MIIYTITQATKLGFIIILLLLIFGVEVVLSLGVWTFLLATSAYGNQIMSKCIPTVTVMAGGYNKLVDKITGAVKTAITAQPKAAVEKIFYFYHYERWWLLKEWQDCQIKFSDEDNRLLVVPKI